MKKVWVLDMEEYVERLLREKEEFERRYRTMIEEAKRKAEECMRLKEEKPDAVLPCDACPYRAVCPYWSGNYGVLGHLTVQEGD